MEQNENGRKDNLLALLIDADNISADFIQDILKISRSLGIINFCRAYGNSNTFKDCTSPWINASNIHGVDVRHVYPYNGTKNLADVELMLDAMELWASGRYRDFVIATGDSDYTRLVNKLLSYGVNVYVIGQQNTADCHKERCTKFFELKKTEPPVPNAPKPASPKPATVATDAKPVVQEAPAPKPNNSAKGDTWFDKLPKDKQGMKPKERDDLIGMLKRQGCHSLKKCLAVLEKSGKKDALGYLIKVATDPTYTKYPAELLNKDTGEIRWLESRLPF